MASTHQPLLEEIFDTVINDRGLTEKEQAYMMGIQEAHKIGNVETIIDLVKAMKTHALMDQSLTPNEGDTNA